MTYKKNFFSYNTRLSEVIKKINKLNHKLIFVLKNKKLVGTLSDGDIRRFFVKNTSHDICISSLMNKKPIFFYENQNYKLDKINNNIYLIPILNKKKEIIKILNLKNSNRKYDNSVIIIAGGKGKRLRPITSKIPKPMIKINNEPHLYTLTKKIYKNGFSDIILSLNYKKNYIKNYFDKKKLPIKYCEEKKSLGTAGPIKLAFKKFNLKFPIIVINADLITDLEISNLLDFHSKHKSDLIVCIKEKKLNLPFAVINQKKNKIIAIEEKPTHKYFFNTGIYLLEKKIINLINEKMDMPNLIKKAIIKRKNVESFYLFENWIDFGSRSELKKILSK
tara:strand:- start:937 stop:1938 length:1002 start_codon:yes stop_codon:yes gene_type:complete